jgi:hypothetical protein
MTDPNQAATDAEWRILAGQLVALARLVDVQLERTTHAPAELVGEFLEAASIIIERFEAVVTHAGRAHAGQLPPDAIETFRNAVLDLRHTATTLGDLASALDPHRHGRRSR